MTQPPTSKRQILIAICETPGWQPPSEPPSSVERAVNELRAEGWIMPRLDGWEATERALTEYPQFASQKDIAAAPPEADQNTRPEQRPDSLVRRLPLISVAEHQQVQTVLELPGLKGSVVIANTSNGRYEIAVELTITRVSE